MKLLDYDEKSKVETWKCMNIGSDKRHDLDNFLSNGYRIFDTKEKKVVVTKLDLHRWIKEKSL